MAPYRARVGTPASHHRTLWEEGHHPGRRVVLAAGLTVLLVVLLDLAVDGGLSLLFDVVFVLVCVGAALAVRPPDFFPIGVLPPLLMGLTVATLAVSARGAVADVTDGFLQALVSGLALHAGSLVTGYGLVLAILAIRQVALRTAGALRTREHLPPGPHATSARR